VVIRERDQQFIPQDVNLLGEYEQGWKINEIMPVNSVGIVTARDDLTIHWSKEEVWETVKNFASLPVEEAREKYQLSKDARDWKVHLAQDDLKSGKGLSKDHIAPILYRPFDVRYTYYTGKTRGFICMPRPEVMKHILSDKNLGFIATRTTKDQWDCLATRNICGHKSCAAYDINTVFPIYLYDITGKVCSFISEFVTALEKIMELAFIPDSQGDLQTAIGPEDIFHYAYAIFHSPTYRSRYAAFLKIDFPRLPLTSNQTLFRQLMRQPSPVIPLPERIRWMPFAMPNRLIPRRGECGLTPANTSKVFPRMSGMFTSAAIRCWLNG